MHRTLTLFLLVLSTLACSTSSTTSETASSCDTSAITTYNYLMAFHACPSDCSNPANHTIYLAGSDDGISWTLVPDFTPISGSVPDLVYYNNFLYIFHTEDTGWAKLNSCFETVAEETISLISDEDSGGYVDPSPIVSGDDLVLFYLPGVIGQDPAGCASYPCTKEIHSAADPSSDLTEFTQVSGERAQVSLTSGSFSDPEVIALNDGTFLLYVSMGQKTAVFTGNSLTDTFASPDGSATRFVNTTAGGVPTAIEVGDEVWIYTTSSSGGVEVIKRAANPDGITLLADSAYTTVIDHAISSSFSSTTSVSSPSIIAWPDADWSQTSP